MFPVDPIEKPNILSFSFRRFLIELSRNINNHLGFEVPVMYQTNTDYVDPDTGDATCEPPVDKAAKAVIPSIVVRSFDIAENRVDYSAHFPKYPASKVIAGKVYRGFTLRNPPRVYTASMGIRIFADRTRTMFDLQRAFLRYFDIYPYLFIPKNLNDEHATGVGDVSALLDRYFDDDDDSLGHFLEQEIPINEQAFTSSSPSNNDNVYVADTRVTLGPILLSDGVVRGFAGTTQSAGITVYEKGNPLGPSLLIDLEDLDE